MRRNTTKHCRNIEGSLEVSAQSKDQTNESAAAIASMQDAYLTLLNEVGEAPERDGLKDTPLRAAKALHFLTQGYRMISMR
jgi:GTP cyclohydrolase I